MGDARMAKQEPNLLDDLPGLLLVGLLLLVVVMSVVVTDAAEGLEVLVPIIGLSLVASYLMARSHFRQLFVGVLTVAYGSIVVWTLIGRQMGPGLRYGERLLLVTVRLGTWIERVALDNAYGDDNLIFVLILGLVAWMMTFNAIWNLFRERRLWRAVIPAGLGLLISAYYYYGPLRIDLFVGGFLFLVFSLAVRTTSLNREMAWREARAGFTPRDRWRLMQGGMVAVVVLLAAAWFVPSASANDRLAELWDRSDNPLLTAQETFDRLFNALRGGPTATPTYYAGSLLNLGGPVNLSDTPVMTVYAPPGYRYYWRAKVFDSYRSGTWWTPADARLSSDFGQLRPEEDEVYRLRQSIQQRFQVNIPATRLLYAAPQPIAFSSQPVFYDAVFNAPAGEDYATITLVNARTAITQGESYGVTSSISIADEASLRLAGTAYPQWVRDRYLQLPGSITDRTRQLAQDIASGHDTPYDIARAVEAYLRENITYETQINAPPDGAEPVDYLLFESREGYCTYYASAMAVLLRSLGVPARVSAGFAQGTLDPAINAYVVAESDAHTWVEVYFPGYGWLEFEPTSSRDPIVREEQFNLDDLANLEDQPLAPDAQAGQPTPTPRPTSIPPGSANTIPPVPEAPHRSFSLPPLLRWLGFLILFGGIAVGGVWLWMERRGLHGLSEIGRAYAQLNIFAPLVGVIFKPGDTPYERGAAYQRTLPDAAPEVDRIVDLHVQEQYTPGRVSLLGRYESYQTAREAWSRLRGLLLRSVVLRRLARLNPFNRDITIR